MLPSGKRGLPPPPSIKPGSRPLPQEPQGIGDANDAPPPLPLRPGQKSVYLPHPPPIEKIQRIQTPPSSGDEDLLAYEEPGVNFTKTQLPIPPFPKPDLYEQETYDDFHDVRPMPTPPSMDGSLETSEDDEGDGFYEFMPEQDESSPSRRPLPQPPSTGIPVIPQRLPQKDHREKSQSPEKEPVAPPSQPPRYQTNAQNQGKKMSADGTTSFGFLQAQLEHKLSTLQNFGTVNGEKFKDEKPAMFMSKKSSPVDVIPMSKREVDTDENAAVSDSSCSKVQKFKLKNASSFPSAISDNLTTAKKINLSEDVKAKPISTTSKSPITAPPVPPSGKAYVTVPQIPPAGKASVSAPPVPPAGKAFSAASTIPPAGKAPVPVIPPPLAGKASITTPPVPPVGKAPINTYTPKPARDIPLEECIYDDGQSYVPDQLEQEEWFHGDIERADAERKLKDLGMDGSYLVRKSKHGGENQPYTLVVYFERHVYNLKMRIRSDNRVALGEEKPEEMSFTDFSTLITHHKTNDVILVTKTDKKQNKTLLRKFPIALNNVKGS